MKQGIKKMALKKQSKSKQTCEALHCSKYHNLGVAFAYENKVYLVTYSLQPHLLTIKKLNL